MARSPLSITAKRNNPSSTLRNSAFEVEREREELERKNESSRMSGEKPPEWLPDGWIMEIRKTRTGSMYRVTPLWIPFSPPFTVSFCYLC